jgi:hypothetical protein
VVAGIVPRRAEHASFTLAAASLIPVDRWNLVDDLHLL